MIVIGLTGYSRVGKDMFASIVKELYSNVTTVKSIAFADELKKTHMDKLGITDINLYNDKLHSNTPHDGINLRDDIYLLSKAIKKRTPRAIVDRVSSEIKRYADSGEVGILIVTDIRFRNEYNFITNSHDIVVRITRGKAPSNIPKWEEDIINHIPNISLDNPYRDDVNDTSAGLLTSLLAKLTPGKKESLLTAEEYKVVYRNRIQTVMNKILFKLL